MPDIDAAYSIGIRHDFQQHNFVANEQHYHFAMFNVIIDLS